MHASKLKDTVDKYMESTRTIAEVCRTISDLAMIAIDPKHTYHPDDFQEEEVLHREEMAENLSREYQRCVGILDATYEARHSCFSPFISLYFMYLLLVRSLLHIFRCI